MNIVSERIKELRVAKGLTQEELGALVGIQKSGVAKYENGRIRSIPSQTLEAFAEALGSTSDYLSGRLEEDLRALNIEVTRARDGSITVKDELGVGGTQTFSAPEWRRLGQDATAGFREVWGGFKKETPAHVSADERINMESFLAGLSPAELVELMAKAAEKLREAHS